MPPSLLSLHRPTLLLFALALLVFAFLTLRFLFILPPHRPPPRKRKRGSPTYLMIVLGSGGHTAEMLALLRDLDPRSYTHRAYVVSSGDAFSAERAREFEAGLRARGEVRWRGDGGVRSKVVVEGTGGMQQEGLDGNLGAKVGGEGDGAGARAPTRPDTHADTDTGSYTILTVPRARRIHQPFLTTPSSALRCLITCLRLLSSPPPFAPPPSSASPTHKPPPSSQHPSPPFALPPAHYPDLILTNGPGTAVIVILAALLLRFFDVGGVNSSGSMRTIYVESWARVRRLSLSGRLLVRVVDRFLVQWEGLEGCGGGRGEFRGVLV